MVTKDAPSHNNKETNRETERERGRQSEKERKKKEIMRNRKGERLILETVVIVRTDPLLFVTVMF